MKSGLDCASRTGPHSVSGTRHWEAMEEAVISWVSTETKPQKALPSSRYYATPEFAVLQEWELISGYPT